MPGKTVIQLQSRAGGESPSSAAGRWQLRWGSVVNQWADPFDVCRPNGQRSSRLALVISLDIVDGRLSLEAWLETSNGRRPLLPKHVAEETVQLDGSLCHIDVVLPDNGRLVVTMDHAADRLLYARSSLLERPDIPAGSFDPPTLRRVSELPPRHNGYGDRSAGNHHPSGERH